MNARFRAKFPDNTVQFAARLYRARDYSANGCPARHSREGGNPEVQHSGPAFAGMT